MIKAYFFSRMTRQINHTYYSLYGTSIGPSKFFYNFKNNRMKHFSLFEPFIYEVEIYPESIVGCFDDYIEARKYKIVREIKFIEYLKELDLARETTEEFNSILNGNCSELDLIEEFHKLLKKKILDLTIYERLKFLVILNQTKIKIPLILLKEDYQIHYIKILEFYKIAYDYSKLNYHESEIENQKWFGSNVFENIDNQTTRLISNLFSNYSYISNLILARKITQEQFELCCEDIMTGGYISNLSTSSLISGYKIPDKYLSIFYPNIFHLELKDISALIKSGTIDSSLAIRLLENNYMIEGLTTIIANAKRLSKLRKSFLKTISKL